jgi:hypothetical protein
MRRLSHAASEDDRTGDKGDGSGPAAASEQFCRTFVYRGSGKERKDIYEDAALELWQVAGMWYLNRVC